jgi:hypothetical protein
MGRSSDRQACFPASQPHSQCVRSPHAHFYDGALTSQALRSRCRSRICVLSERPSKRALGEDVMGMAGAGKGGPRVRTNTKKAGSESWGGWCYRKGARQQKRPQGGGPRARERVAVAVTLT